MPTTPPILSPADHAFFKEHGYVRVRNVIPADACRRVVDDIFNFLGFDPANPADWYRLPLKPRSTVIEIYQAQSMWDNRQSPRLYQLFAELYGDEKLHVSLDRASFKPPCNPAHPDYEDAGFLHLDADPKTPYLWHMLQGVLCLTRTEADQGGFQCIPGFARQIHAWVKSPKDQRPPEPPSFEGIAPTPIVGDAGDMIVWDSYTPHGAGRNTSDRPRLAQYITMIPAWVHTPATVSQRVACWQNHTPPGGPGSAFPGDPRKIEETQGKTADLTPLGRKLLGVDAW